ncbi:PEP-CTERM sorting domain-containing protein [Roseateles sp.]|uniref:PEP-CTERM sorting domain-containing protein n=1 Tax=Roseateles sp. TaxID=1971397 RepID=UPI003BAC85E9
MLTLKATFATLALAGLTGLAGADTTNGIANGGFETAATDPAYFAAGWLAAPTGSPALLSNVAHTGAHSALLTVPAGFGASTLFQDSSAHGGLPQLTAANVGDTPMLSFWAMGDVGTTGNILFALRYVGPGGILADSGNQFFQGAINASGWTQISFQAGAIPAGATSVFLEMSTAVGPLLDGRANAVYIDDIQLTLTTAVPEPASVAMLIAGLGALAVLARRRRA